MKTIDELESRLQALVEGYLVKYIPGYRPEDQIARLLASAMHQSLVDRGDLHKAPNIYTIIAHPSTLTNWGRDNRLFHEMADALLEVGTDAGYIFSSRPRVATAANNGLKPGEIKVMASFSTEPLAETRDAPPFEQPNAEGKDEFPPNAFLVIDGTRIIPLDRPVVNIGRRLGNHIVIDDPRVSRSHAQIRIVKGRFVIFDLDSTGGVYVNGNRSSQTVLYPGDLISLAGVSLIFGQDLPSGRIPEEKTSPGSSLSSDRPTAILNPNPNE